MERLFQIHGSYDLGDGLCSEKSWRGFIVTRLEDNCWFEGVVSDHDSPGGKYVTGTLVNEDLPAIAFFKFNNGRLPSYISATNYSNSFEGFWGPITPGGIDVVGGIRIACLEYLDGKDIVDKLRDKISKLKGGMSDYESQLLEPFEDQCTRVTAASSVELEMKSVRMGIKEKEMHLSMFKYIPDKKS